MFRCCCHAYVQVSDSVVDGVPFFCATEVLIEV
jgi:hypothetical protein